MEMTCKKSFSCRLFVIKNNDFWEVKIDENLFCDFFGVEEEVLSRFASFLGV